MNDTRPAQVPDDWFEMRQALHARYEELNGLNDASSLGYLHGPKRNWTEDEVVEIWREAANAGERRRDAINHVYIHVPFCKSICSFCNYDRLRPSDPRLLTEYTDRVFNSLHKIGPVVKPMRWHTLYFGGGTASVLPAKMLKQLLVGIDETLRWHPNSTRFFEFDPAVFNKKKLAVLMEHGFEHFSFGVQTLTTTVNEDHNRGAQSRDLVKRRFDDLRDGGIFNISCDFLLGLKGTNPDQMVEEIAEVLKLGPRWIDLYYLTPTREYIQSHFGGNWEAFWTHIKPFHDRIPELARQAAKENGYKMRRGHGHNIILYRQMGPHERKKGGRGGIFSYTQLVDQQRRPLHLLGLGTSARSLIFGQAAIECRGSEDLGRPEEGHYYVGQKYGMEGEVRLFLMHILRDNDIIDRAMFSRIFGMDIVEAIPQAAAAWQRLGLISMDKDEFKLSREERRQRVRTLLWCVPDSVLQHEVNRQEQNILAQAKKKESDKRKRDEASSQPRAK